MKRLLLGAALVGGLLCLLAGARADEDAGDVTAFEKAFERLHQDFKREKFESGLRRLKSLLERHAKQPYVRARRVEIEDLAERFAFGAAHEAPTADDVLLGRVQKFDPSTGYLKLTIQEEQSGDLERVQGSLRALPAKASGPFLLEIRGSSYPPSPSHAPQVVLTGDEHPRTGKRQTWVLTFGSPPRTKGSTESWLPASIQHVDGSTKKEVAKQDVVSIPLGKAYKLQVKATKTQIKMAVNGKTLCTCKKHRDVWGFLAFEARSWTKLTFTGSVEPAWIQDRLDKAVLAQRKAFDAGWDPKQVLPAWLYEGVASTPAATPTKRPELPVEVDRKLRSKVRRVRSDLKRGRWVEARRRLADLVKAGAPAPVTDYLSALVYAEAGFWSKALADVDRCLQAAPDFLEGLIFKAALQRMLGKTDDALATLRSAMQRHPQDPLAYERAAVGMLLAGRIGDAKDATEKAALAGVRSKTLDALGKAVIRAERGPTWNAVHEYKSRNYHVLSDIDKKTCMEAARLLEEALTSYRVGFHWVTRDKEQLYKVYLFSGQRGFMNYMAELQGMMGKPTERAAGVYSPLLKQLLIWNLPDRDAMLETVRHEGFHQYLDRFLPDAPIWFNEGMAVYHENARKIRGKLEFGQNHPSLVRLLKQKGLVPLAEFLYLTPQRFYAAGVLSYAQAWALIHMLRQGSAENRALFRKLVDALQESSPLEAIATHIPEDRAKRLDEELQAYVAGLPAN